MRKIFSLLMCGLMSMQVFAADFTVGYLRYNILIDNTVEVATEEGLDLTAFGSDRKVVIPGNVTYNDKEYKVVQIGQSAFDADYYNEDLFDEVEIPSTVTTIAQWAFYTQKSLKSVLIPNSVTTIGAAAFYGCSKLATVDIPASVVSIDNYAFSGCTNLSSVSIPSNVTSIGQCAFENCTGLETVDIPASVKNIGSNVFNGCTSLTKVTAESLEGWLGISFANDYSNPLQYAHHLYIEDTLVTDVIIPETITSIGQYKFRGCTDLKTVDIPASVVSIGNYAFSGCTNLSLVMVPYTVTSIGTMAFENVPEIRYAGTATGAKWGAKRHLIADNDFIYADNTRKTITEYIGTKDSVVIPSYVETIEDGAFYNNELLKNVDLGTTLKNIGNYAFCGCVSLSNVDIPSTVTTIGSYAFAKVKHINYNGDATFSTTDRYWGAISINGYTDGDFVYASNTNKEILAYVGNDETVVIPDGVESINTKSFQYCKNLKSVVIPNTVTKIGDYAFEECNNLKSVDVPDGVSTIGISAFNGVLNINYKGDADDYNGDNWGANFRNCIVDGDFVYSDDTKNNLKYYVGKSSNVVIPQQVKVIEPYAFYENAYVTDITFGNSVTTIGDSAFYNCYNLQSINIPNTVKQIGGGAFQYCVSLKTATLSNSLTSISEKTFFRCESLESITIPSKVESIGIEAFAYCCDLASVSIPNSVKSIGEFAFYDCESLKNLNIPETVESIDYCAFGYVWHIVYNGTAKYDSPNDNYWGATYMNYLIDGDFIYADSTKNALLLYIGNGGIINNISDSVSIIAEYAFANSKNVLSVNVPEKVYIIGENAFEDVRHIVYNRNASNANDDKWGAMFKNGVVDGDFVYTDSSKTNLMVYIGKGGNVTIPNSVKVIGDSAFIECGFISSVNIPKSVKSIGEYAFMNCNGLTSIVIGDSVESIGYAAFAASGAIAKTVYIPGQVKCIDNYAFIMDAVSYSYHFKDSREIPSPDPNKYATIYCHATSQPATWSNKWNADNLNVVWGSLRVDLSANNSAYGTVTGTEFVAANARTITISATPANGYHFVRWSNGITTSRATITVTSDTVVTAIFERHIIVVDKAKEPTCTEKGLTEGTHCSFCRIVFVSQYDIPATGHTEVVDSAVVATCTLTGLTEGKHCSVCKTTLVKQDTIAALGHTMVVDSAVAYTCTHFGLTEGKHCSVCDSIFVKQDTIAAAHNIVVVSAVSATCTAVGFTEGKYCSVCDSVFVAQDTVPMLKHLFTNYIYNNDATTEADGTETAYCDHGCGVTDTRIAEGTKLTDIAGETANGVAIYAHHNVIVVENADADIHVFDATGRCVEIRKSCPSVEIEMRHQGLYIVKVGTEVKRVVVSPN